MTRPFFFSLAAIALLVPLILISDGPGLPHQLLLGFCTAAALILYSRHSTVPRTQIIAAVIIASIGEVVLSVGWGLYTYRDAMIPLYVPFGHGIFYALATDTARQRFFVNHARRIVRGVMVMGTLYAMASWWLAGDTWGALWWIAAAILVMRSNTLLLSICFVYTVALELLGTALGNWRWSAMVPGLRIHSANPPSGVGLLYVLLDTITIAVCAYLATRASAPAFTPPRLSCQPE